MANELAHHAQKCKDLAAAMLADEGEADRPENRATLAQVLQDTAEQWIEDWVLEARARRRDDDRDHL